MFLNVFKVRLAMALAGIIVLVGYVAAGGSFGGKSSIIIDFGMYSRDLEGARVEIDGEVAGTLQMFGQATRTAFAVKDGEHTVRILHPDLAGHPQTVITGVGGRDVMLIADIFEMRGEDGEVRATIGFQ